MTDHRDPIQQKFGFTPINVNADGTVVRGIVNWAVTSSCPIKGSRKEKFNPWTPRKKKRMYSEPDDQHVSGGKKARLEEGFLVGSASAPRLGLDAFMASQCLLHATGSATDNPTVAGGPTADQDEVFNLSEDELLAELREWDTIADNLSRRTDTSRPAGEVQGGSGDSSHNTTSGPIMQDIVTDAIRKHFSGRSYSQLPSAECSRVGQRLPPLESRPKNRVSSVGPGATGDGVAEIDFFDGLEEQDLATLFDVADKASTEQQVKSASNVLPRSNKAVAKPDQPFKSRILWKSPRTYKIATKKLPLI